MSFPSTLKRAIPPVLKPIAKAIYYKVFRLQLRTRSWLADHLSMPSDHVPVPSAILRFRVIESLSVDKFLRIGAGGANLIRQRASEMGIDLASANRVLEFGCGCGRTIGWFLRDGGNAEFHGVDVDAEAVDWCRRHLPRGHFLATAPHPPLPYAAEYFDFVYCLSVFTHLDETMQDIWSRILKPGGVLLLTIYGKAASKVLDVEGQKILRTLGFVHRRSQKLRGLVPDWYHTTWHSREYIVQHRPSALSMAWRYPLFPGSRGAAGHRCGPKSHILNIWQLHANST